MNIDLLKKEYIKLIKTNGICKDINILRKIENCKILKVAHLKGDEADTDFDNNIINLGQNASEITLFHELEHLRKGSPINNTGIEEELVETSEGELKLKNPRYGIFFDEAITERMAIYLFGIAKIPYENKKDTIEKRKKGFYSTNLIVIKELAELLRVSEVDLCEVIELKHHKHDKQIDKHCELIAGQKDFFKTIENKLDFVETIHYLKYVMPNKNICRESLDKSNKYLQESINQIQDCKRNTLVL